METSVSPQNRAVSDPQTQAAPDQPVPKYSYYALGILTLVNFLNYIDRQILPSVAPMMSKDLGLTDTELGAIEAALLLSFTILAPVFGRLGDRYSRTRLMAAAAVIWSIATGLAAFADHVPFAHERFGFSLPWVGAGITISGVALTLCVVRAVVGVGESSYSTITPSLIADYFPHNRRGTALGVFQAAIPMGFALGFVIGAVLAHFFGWRVAFMLVGLPGLIVAAFVWRLKEPRRGVYDVHENSMASETETAESAPQSGAIRTAISILRTRDWFLSTAGYTALTFVLGAFATWANLLLVREKGMTETGAGIALGIITLTAGALGTFGGGWVADHLARGRDSAYFTVCALGSLLGIGPLLVALSSVTPAIYLPAVFLTVFLLFINNAPFHAILINSVPASVRAMSVALNIVVIHTLGDVISRFGVGVLSDSIKDGGTSAITYVAHLLGINPVQQHLSSALLVAPIALLVSAGLFFAGARANSKG